MSTTKEISEAIRKLPADEQWSLLHEFADELWADWDTQIEADVSGGKLDQFLNEARAEIQASNTIPLDEIIRNS